MRKQVSLGTRLQLGKVRKNIILLPSVMVLLFAVGFITLPYLAARLKASAASSGNAQLEIGVSQSWASLTTSGSVAMDVTDIAQNGTLTVSQADAIAATNSPTGYRLYLTAANEIDETPALISSNYEDDSLPTIASKDATAPAVFDQLGTWGYAAIGADVPAGLFSNSYATGSFNGATAGLYRGLNSTVADAKPATGLIAQSNTPATNGSITSVYYGAYLGHGTPAGSYSANVTYTMVAEFTDGGGLNPNDPSVYPGVDPNKPAGSDDDQFAYVSNGNHYYYGEGAGNYYYYDASGTKVTAQGVNKTEDPASTIASVVADGNITWAAVAIVAGASATFLAIALLRDREDEDEE